MRKTRKRPLDKSAGEVGRRIAAIPRLCQNCQNFYVSGSGGNRLINSKTGQDFAIWCSEDVWDMDDTGLIINQKKFQQIALLGIVGAEAWRGVMDIAKECRKYEPALQLVDEIVSTYIRQTTYDDNGDIEVNIP